MAQALTSMKVGDLNTGLIAFSHSDKSRGFRAEIAHEGSVYVIEGTLISKLPFIGTSITAITSDGSQRGDFNSKFTAMVTAIVKSGSAFYTRGKYKLEPEKFFKWTAKKV